MRKVKFKKPGQTIKPVKGGLEISEANLTPEIYDNLVNRNSNYKRLFIVTDDEVKTEPLKINKSKPDKD